MRHLFLYCLFKSILIIPTSGMKTVANMLVTPNRKYFRIFYIFIGSVFDLVFAIYGSCFSFCTLKHIKLPLLFFQVRHPNILSFLHSTETETFDSSTTKVTIYIVTEPVMPLSEKIKELGLEGTQRYGQYTQLDLFS